MTTDEAIQILSAAFTAAGFSVESLADSLVVTIRDQPWRVSNSFVEAFRRFQDDSASRQALKIGSGVYDASSAECALAQVDDDYGFRSEVTYPITFGIEEGVHPFGVVGPASDTYVASCLLASGYLAGVYHRARVTRPRARPDQLAGDGSAPDLRFLRPVTIRLGRLPPSSAQFHAENSGSVIGACLFAIASTSQVTFRVLDGWPAESSESDRRKFYFEDSGESVAFEFPRVGYSPDLLRFYTLGMSSDVPELQYLAFYQVLEYFFLALADEQLYSNLSRRLSDPRFRPVAAWYDRLIQDVADHKRSTDETEMLKLVLARYVPHDELMSFLERFHSSVGDKRYWSKLVRFGTNLSISKEPNHTFGDVARIVKAVRNALVHSSDRHEREQRHVPFSESSKLVRCEVPLVRFLAERVIIGSASALS